MIASRSKILKKKGQEPNGLEMSIAQTFYDIEHSGSSINRRIAPLKIAGAREFIVSPKKKALIIFVPFAQLAAYRKVHTLLVPELEKKMPGKSVVIVAKRRVIPEPPRGHKYSQPIPRSRTVADVQEKILDDLVYPTEIIGKRIRHRADGTQLLKVHLGQRDKHEILHKIDTLEKVYLKLTGKHASFEFTY
ncbi:putative small subunit ribosomal protein 7 [Monocercomonoides exilis]|uniref:putative small subunit ribosomal protein 7 n=1 Tax=Monocercomonoides exilis TaxID=2049356 RepID=UPI00355A429E|nr:putative small subunit ribosomal protein 7 [Monocercomonoides exilis]|eukprot:MONOS_3728.1-p1 / transcript=MONOS_3728.1 / gene=MONOS_3728 / organism=Monocercomonoides_exilis_PA203 / gene_product=small subunit ribosomal protein 7 / transcript_product=small subunit ribosomal protein 7 / location=Mono_scaffold00090:125043-125615(-) / protein_length=190 / sequence_SO=supercontig / SO=protein_coding / is_pseudo=false